MKIAFLFPSDFDILTVSQRPLGGSESAVTYLALALTKRGHQVDLYTNAASVMQALGVNCYPFQLNNGKITIPTNLLQDKYDVIIVKNGIPEVGAVLRHHITSSFKLIFWTGHAYDQPAIQSLTRADYQQAYDQFICVSDWQANTMQKHFNLTWNKISIMRNAISPWFENLFVDQVEFIAHKMNKVTLAYTSTPFRGLSVLLQIFSELAKISDKIYLKLFTSMQVYGISESQDQCRDLYHKAKLLPQTDYLGSLLQIQLAAQMRDCTMLAYPNIFPETSCIAVMEALAAGCDVLTSNLAALPETCLGYSSLTEPPQNATAINAYLTAAKRMCQDQLKADQGYWEKRYQVVNEMNQHHTWQHRAIEFEKIIKKISAVSGSERKLA